MSKKNFDPIVGQFPEQEKIQCATCKKRLTIILAGKDIGPMNSYCKEYTEEDTNGKPIEILFQNEKCDFYEKDV